MDSLIESNLSKFDLRWNLVFLRFSIFKTTAIVCIIPIANNNWGYFNTFGSILSNFYDVDILVTVKCNDYNWYRYESSTVMVIMILSLMYKIEIMMVLTYYCFLPMIDIAKRKLYLGMMMINGHYSYDYGICSGRLCKSSIANYTSDKYNFNDCILYSMYQAWIHKHKKYKITKLYNVHHIVSD